MTTITWPINMAEELKELDKEFDKGTDYTQLMLSHLNYKAALLGSGVMQALFGITLSPLAKPVKERTERDSRIVNVILHLIRNLAFINDLPVDLHLSADQAEFSLRSKLIKSFFETHPGNLLSLVQGNQGHVAGC